jgi:hypothetical protein
MHNIHTYNVHTHTYIYTYTTVPPHRPLFGRLRSAHRRQRKVHADTHKHAAFTCGVHVHMYLFTFIHYAQVSCCRSRAQMAVAKRHGSDQATCSYIDTCTHAYMQDGRLRAYIRSRQDTVRERALHAGAQVLRDGAETAERTVPPHARLYGTLRGLSVCLFVFGSGS